MKCKGGRTSLIVLVGNPPMATIDEPLDGTIYAVGETVTFRGTVTDSEDQPNQIDVEWNSDVEGVLQSGNVNSQGLSGLLVPIECRGTFNHLVGDRYHRLGFRRFDQFESIPFR